MISVTEAFRKFRSRLELTEREQADASRRQQDIRALLAEHLARKEDFLSGSYARYTKTKPLKDVDIMYVLHEDERKNYRTDQLPTKILAKVERILADEYGAKNVHTQRRSVTVEFPVAADEERVVSFDVVPAFTKATTMRSPTRRRRKAGPKPIPGCTRKNPPPRTKPSAASGRAWCGC